MPSAETVQQDAPRASAPSVANAPAARKTVTSAKVTSATPSAASTTSPVQIAAPKKEKGFPHFTHMGIALCTLFLWTPFWLLHFVIWKSFKKKAKA